MRLPLLQLGLVLFSSLPSAHGRSFRLRRQPAFTMPLPAAPPVQWSALDEAETLQKGLSLPSVATGEEFANDGEALAEVEAGFSSTPQPQLPAWPSGAPASAVEPDEIERATLQVEQETKSLTNSQASQPLISMATCEKATEKLGAMSCSLVTQISGSPEGCECHFEASECPPVDQDLGFTGVSPSMPLSPPQLGGLTVILCMYWQWLPPPDNTQAKQEAAAEVRNYADSLVRVAHARSMAIAKKVADTMWAGTLPPAPLTTTAAIPTRAIIFGTLPPTTPYPFAVGAPGPAPAVSFSPAAFTR
mmetsp:Transcript_154147/g.287376  ORF Transcript_154147/g.287376 Transcript_154147/m.287376 type:complete len:304 (-) Transcript_154147:28-939(-)